jgi:hypothetical protein
VAEFLGPQDSLSELLKRADQALYEAKNTGKKQSRLGLIYWPTFSLEIFVDDSFEFYLVLFKLRTNWFELHPDAGKFLVDGFSEGDFAVDMVVLIQGIEGKISPYDEVLLRPLGNETKSIQTGVRYLALQKIAVHENGYFP